MQNNVFISALKRDRAPAGLNNTESSFRTFKHSYSSLLSAKNRLIKAIMNHVGHEGAKITNRIYTHVTSSIKTNIIEQLEANGSIMNALFCSYTKYLVSKNNKNP